MALINIKSYMYKVTKQDCNFQVQIVEITKILIDISLIPWSSLLSREVKKNPQNSSTSIHCMLVCLEQILFKLELFDWAMLSLSNKVMGVESFTFCYPQISIFCLLWKGCIVIQSIKLCLYKWTVTNFARSFEWKGNRRFFFRPPWLYSVSK